MSNKCLPYNVFQPYDLKVKGSTFRTNPKRFRHQSYQDSYLVMYLIKIYTKINLYTIIRILQLTNCDLNTSYREIRIKRISLWSVVNEVVMVPHDKVCHFSCCLPCFYVFFLCTLWCIWESVNKCHTRDFVLPSQFGTNWSEPLDTQSLSFTNRETTRHLKTFIGVIMEFITETPMSMSNHSSVWAFVL